MLLQSLASSKISEYGGIVEAYAALNHKYQKSFDWDKVWVVVEDNPNYLNATPKMDETQLKFYTKKFIEKFKGCSKDEIDLEQFVEDLLVIMALKTNINFTQKGNNIDINIRDMFRNMGF